MTLQSGVREQRCYNSRLQMETLKVGANALAQCAAEAADPLWLQYGYGSGTNNGNVMSQRIKLPGLDVTQIYTYDALNRIASVNEGAEYRTFQYSPTGNMWVDQASTNLAPPPSSTPRTATWFDQSNRISSFGYDAVGNLTSMGGYSLAYDAENRMKTATIGTAARTYAYDGEGRRVRAGNTVYVYDASGALAAEYNGTDGGSGTQFLVADSLGSTRMVMNASGGVVRRYDFLPFGDGIRADLNGRATAQGYDDTEGGPGSRLRFTGKERDTELMSSALPSGLDYFGARYLSSAQGRFTSPDPPLLDQDPADPQSWNLYAYVRNNPLKYVDLTGNDCVYTNNFSQNGTITVERGSCSQKGGTFVDGTIDVKSITYDSRKNELGYSYSNAEKETGGAGTIGMPTAPTMQEQGLAALQRAGQIASPVTDPRFIAGWYGASALAGYALYAGGAFSSEFTALNIGQASATAESSSLTSTAVGSGLRRQIAAHRQKLAEYLRNPDAFDNKGFLKNASPELRQRIIEGRAKHLEQEIRTFEKALEKLLGGK